MSWEKDFIAVFGLFYFGACGPSVTEAYRLAQNICDAERIPITHSLGVIRRRLKMADNKDMELARAPGKWGSNIRYLTKAELAEVKISNPDGAPQLPVRSSPSQREEARRRLLAHMRAGQLSSRAKAKGSAAA